MHRNEIPYMASDKSLVAYMILKNNFLSYLTPIRFTFGHDFKPAGCTLMYLHGWLYPFDLA